MKTLAVLLIGCIIFLSSFSGMVSASTAIAKMDCCKKKPDKAACNHKTTKDEAGACEKPVCNMLFTCSICGFIPVGTFMLPSNFASQLKKPVPLYKTGNLSDYHKADWKPPKVC